MDRTVFILGNGFDLAMGRKTSYQDFLIFARMLKVLKTFFIDKDKKLDEDDVRSAYQEFIRRLDMIFEKYSPDYVKSIALTSSYLKLNDSDKFCLCIDYLSNHNKNSIHVFREGLDGDDPIDQMSIRDFFISFEEQLAKYQTFGTTLHFDVQELINLLYNQNQYGDVIKLDFDWLFKLPENWILKYLEKHGIHLGENWSNIEYAISDLAEALIFIKMHITEFSKIFDADINGLVIELLLEDFKHLAIYEALETLIGLILSDDKRNQLNRVKYLEYFNGQLISSLEYLTLYLEFYLIYQEQLEGNKTDFPNSLRAIIENGEQEYFVLTFNYTNTLLKVEKSFDFNQI